MSNDPTGLRDACEVEGHLGWLDSFTSAALGVLAVASGIYTYLGLHGLLDDGGALALFAAVAYSAAVSTGIFVFWSYLMRLLPAMRTAATRLWLALAMVIGGDHRHIVLAQRRGARGVGGSGTAPGADRSGLSERAGACP